QRFTELGVALAAADVRANRGFAAALTGALPVALHHYEEARRAHRRLGVERANVLIDEARVLLEANLVAAAHRTATAGVQGLRVTGRAADLAEGLLLLAATCVAAGLPAGGPAREAQALFDAQDRPAWSVLAAWAALRA